MIMAMLLVALGAKAVKADPQPATVTQSDGTQLMVRLVGDEDFHYYETLDGVLLCQQGSTYYVAAVADDGTLTATTQIAHEQGQRSVFEETLAGSQDRSLFLNKGVVTAAKARVMREAIETSGTLLTHTGSPRVVVILAQFADVEFTINDPVAAFEQYLNGDEQTDLGNYNTRNYGSVRQYFAAMSDSTFTPQFDVYGPVTLENNLAYYGADDDDMSRFIPAVCSAMDDSLDFSQYDADGNGYVDLLYVIYAGYSESVSGNSTDCIWPKSGTLSGGTYDGVSIRRYGVNNEINFTEEYNEANDILPIAGIGLFCHEFSHCLGMPDLYVTSGDDVAYANNQEMEYWSIMDSGTYVYNGYAPAAYTAWEREAFGWFTIDTLTEAGEYELLPIDNGGHAYRIMNDSDATGHEYYILENIQQEGWNYRQYAHGMIAIHVDYDSSAFSISNNTVNNTAGHPRMTVLAADGELTNTYSLSSTTELRTTMGGDPFPGTSEVTELTDTSTVYPIVYTGEGLGKPIYDISEDTSTGTVTFTFISKETTDEGEGDDVDDGDDSDDEDGDDSDDSDDGDDSDDSEDGDDSDDSDDSDDESGISSVSVSSREADTTVYTLDGRAVGTSVEGLPGGVYIVNGHKVTK